MASQASILKALHYAYPVAIFFFYSLASLAFSIREKRVGKDEKLRLPTSSRLIVSVSLAAFFSTYIAQLVAVGLRLTTQAEWLQYDHVVIHCLSCLLVFGIQLIHVRGNPPSNLIPYFMSWILALPFEIAIEALEVSSAISLEPNTSQLLILVLSGVRCVLLAAVVVFFLAYRFVSKLSSSRDEERQALLDSSGQPTSAQEGGRTSSTYGSTDQQDEDSYEHITYRMEREQKEAMEKRLREDGGWFQYAMGFKILLPHVWPFRNRQLQIRAVAVFLCLLGSNFLNVLIPRQTAIVVDSLLGTHKGSPWLAVLVFVALRLLSSDCGIHLLRSWLWMPLRFYSEEGITRAGYAHIMQLSADFHDSKMSSEMTMAITAGASVSRVVETVLMEAAPMLLDMVVAVIYLSITFGPYEGFITIATGACFMVLAKGLIAMAGDASRLRNFALFKEYNIRYHGFDGWHTAAMFNQLGYEENRHSNAVAERWVQEKNFGLRWDLSVALQSLVLLCGLAASAFLAVWRILQGRATAGQFTMLLMYWSQLTAPLKFFAGLGKTLNEDLVSAERILGIMKLTPSVKNAPGARPLKFVSGEVVLDDVSFSYDGARSVVQHASLEVPGGQTIAFVGSTGAGKSTILKLLNRFYDVTSGTIRIDGQSIREVDLYSLRDRIGVVPQNPHMFNDTIMNNVRYSNLNATDEEVYDACKAACIHDKIKTFTNGYRTKVGVHGAKLSGGEIQRLAIARAILKKPDVVLLDEATSAVDTSTEQIIQASFRKLCQGRTTFIIAHRLSTIMNADRIVVVDNGRFVEQGTHESLVEAKGKYADLWSKQTFLVPKDRPKPPTSSTSNPEQDASSKSADFPEPALAQLPNGHNKPAAAVATPIKPSSGDQTQASANGPLCRAQFVN